MKHLDFNKGFIKESAPTPEMINEFFGTLLVCGVLGAYCSMGVLSVFKKLGGLRNELVDLRQKRLAAKNERMKQKYELEIEKHKYKLLKAGHSTDEIDDIIKTGKANVGDEKEEKELRGLLKKKEADLSPKELARIKELSDRVEIDNVLTDKERETLKSLTGGDTDPQEPQTPQLTAGDKEKLDKEAKEFEAQRNKSLKLMMAYENTIKELPEGPEKDKHSKHLESLTKVMSGSGSPEDIEVVEQFSKESLTPEGQKIAEQVEKSAEKISDEDVEKWKKEKGITDDGLVKTMKTVAKENPKLLGEPEKEPEKEPEGEPAKKDGDPKEPEGEPKKVEPEEFKDPDGTVYKKDENGKCTMTTADGDSTEIEPEEFEKQKKANEEPEEDDAKDGDERTDNDDDLEDEKFDTKGGKATLSDKQDPRKVFKQRTYKRGNKTFRTKSYYSKRGVAISKDEFKERVANWEKKNKKDKVENSSFKGSPWTMTRLCETKKPAPVMEAEQGSDMESICKERLVYIKFVMDTTTNSVEKVKMERMYNTIYNCCFDANGKARSMEDLYNYLNDTMIENKGEIPGLPTNDQVVNIDDKCKAWRKISPDKFDAYMARLNKELLDKTGTKKTDKAKDILSPDGEDSNTSALDKIRDLSTKYGFTNVLGLEPSRKASKEDDEKKDEVNKQEKDGSPKADSKDSKDVKADDVSPEQVDKIVGVSK